MNENTNENGNSQIPEVEDFVIEEGWDADTIKTKSAEHNQKVKEWKGKVAEANSQLFARTKKAEGFELKDGKWVKPNATETNNSQTTESKKDDLSTDDVFTLVQANVPREDIGEVKEYAKLKGISIAEALKSDVVKTILADKAEKRKVADGTNTTGSVNGSSRLSDEALISEANKGNLPDSADDMQRLIVLRKKKK